MCPPLLTNEIERKCQEWYNEEVWEFLHVPKPYGSPHFPKFCQTFLDLRDNWSLGRFIFRDKAFKKAGQKDQGWSINIWGPDGKMIQVPDPEFYC